ncbi:zinc finger domain containing protein [Nitzschia inconspicua]|uniref:Zinc finger domain containing protein n=1 Tax=Nitzschia inconspicua TaxID=303405 RepID=A0A9K3L0G1_9STRA|nr:zinc finger domain containing protein [Nitzschia inconspicua]
MGDAIDDFLSLEPAGDPLPGSSSLSQTRPTLAGLQWLDAPWGKSSGLAYRINGANTLESLLVSSSAENNDDSPTVLSVSDSFTLSAGAVRMTSSHDGRMVAVACCDGSLHCIDATDSCLSLRWSIVDAHSHITPNGDVASPVSTDRANAACASGPVLSLDFSAENYMLILVDAKKGLTMYDARLVTPTNIVTTQLAGPLLNVSSATWCKSLDNSKRALLAIGRYDGSIAILKYNAALLTLQAATELGCPSEEDGFTCTHLNWWSDTLAVGLCRVIPPDDGEGPDEDDEDDNADHEALLYLAAIHEDLALGKRTEWAEQGDVVPFFTVPKYGRHVFYTCFVKSTSKQLLAVAVNVGTDIGVVAKDSDGGDWSVVEFQEGSSASLPTNEDDEFTYPLGISALQTPSSSFRLLLASTDGSLSTLKFNHANDPAYLAAQLIGDPTKLPADPVALVESPNQLEKQNSSNSDDGSAWVVVDESGKKNLPAVDLPKKATSSTVQSLSSISIGHQQAAEMGPGFSFGKSPIQQTSLNPAFGSGSSAPVFGSGTSIPSFFGPSPGTPVFGVTSPLGTQDAMQFSSPLTTKATAPTGLGSIGAHGFASSESSGGFAALAASYKSGVAIPSSSSNPFNSFSQQSTEGSTASSFPTQPLFGSMSNIPKTSTTLATMTLGSDDGSRNQVMSPEKSSKLSRFTDASTPTQTTLLNASSNNPDSEVSVEKSLSEKRPLEVFDLFDTNKSGSVPSSMFEEMLDALGEGFQGEELDAQLALIDPSKTGKLTKSAFVNWYKTLVTSNANENDSLSSGEREERDKEEASARQTFKTLSKTVNGKSCIDSDQFEKLIESLGTTYCKEEHEKTLVVLEKDGNRIYEDDFIEWYIRWLFGGDEESNTSDEDSASKDDKGSSLDPKKSLGSLFQVSGDSWKCEICSVRNEGIVNKCSACETPRPGSEDAGAPANTAGAGSIGSSIGPGGFTFGGSVTGALNASSGFNFGTSAPVTSVPAPSSGGFKFGSSASTSGAPSSGGFHFGAQKPQEPEKDTSQLAEKKPLEVFDLFDTNKSGSVPSSMFEEMLDALGEGFQGEELDAQLALIDPSKTGKLTKSAFVNWYKTLVTSNANENDSLSSGEREERDKEEASARQTFKTLSKTVNGKSCIDSDQFEKLIESLGTTYCKEEHEKTLVVLEKDGNRIYEDDFIEWYIGWLFGGDEESNTSDEDSASKDDKGSSLDPKKSLGSLFQVSGDSWKCEICSVRNEGIVNKCSACETPRPGSEDASAPADTTGAGSIGSSIGPGGSCYFCACT